MADSHPKMYQKSTVHESEIRKLVQNHFLPDREVLRWRPANGEDIPTSNTNKIVVLSSFFQHEFGLPTSQFLCGLLHHYKIELVYLNPNSIHQIVILVHLCEAFLGVPQNVSLFKSYFLLNYQPSADRWKVIGGIGLQTHPHSDFLDLPMKTSL
jgi:hypothetical protein